MVNKDKFSKESRVLKALCHKTRMAIVTELLGEESCVRDIEGRLNARQSNISQHLTVLRQAGIVGFRAEGKNRCYYLKDPETMDSICQALKQVKI
ncbi:MAG: metalloregulator ArsR/SmtB family transcription factor [Candidatus Auribacterota bacterium]|nr:metalloregulator ArsR/SmtB family transcription factor [Candidatus Auribacterota bacterium]